MEDHHCSANQAKRALGLKHTPKKKGKKARELRRQDKFAGITNLKHFLPQLFA